MLKTISAALLAVSVLAAPVLAANTAKTLVTKSATVTPSAQVKKNPLNANAKMGRHHVRHHQHHRFHKKMAAKFHKSLKVSAKPVTHPAKRG
jgi:Ni/Co efflux regulator RcnB